MDFGWYKLSIRSRKRLSMSFDFETRQSRAPSTSSSRPPAFASPRHPWLLALACAAYTFTILLYQGLQGAPKAAFGGYPDESSHYISGLLVRDYLLSGFSMSPLRYAADYYIHVPFFAVGYWPPLFYTAEALWMILFGFSRPAVLVFIALIAAASATLLFACLRDEFGNLAAFGAGFLFLLSPIVLWGSGLVMTDLLVTLLSFAATLSLARYLDSARMWPMLAFSVLAAATILTKSSGAFLAIVPPLAVLVSHKLNLVRRFSFWVGPLVVAVLCAPWFLLTRGLITRGYEKYQKPGLMDTLGQLGLGLLVNLVWLAPLILIGAWRMFRGPRPMPGFAAVCLMQPAAVLVFLIMAPVGNESRYLTPALPVLMILAMYGIRALADVAPPARRTLVMAGLVVFFIGSFVALAAYRLDPVPADTLRPIANFVIERNYHSVLVPSDSEGPMIAEISEREMDRLAIFLVRPSKLLAQTDLNGLVYPAIYKTKEETQALFDQLPLDGLVVRMNPPEDAAEHEILLRDMILAFPNRWHLVRSFGDASSSAGYAVYEPVKLSELSQQDLADHLRNLLIQNLALLR